MGPRLLKRADVQQAIRAVMAPTLKKLEVSREDVLQRLIHLCLRTTEDFFDSENNLLPPSQITERGKCCVNGIKQRTYYDREGNPTHSDLEYKLVPNEVAVDLAMKHKGLFAPTKGEVEVNVNGPVVNLEDMVKAFESRPSQRIEQKIENPVIDVPVEDYRVTVKELIDEDEE